MSKSRKNIFKRTSIIVLKLLWFAIVLCSAVALILACAATIIHPESSSIIVFLGLGCPILILLNVILFAFLAVTKKWLAIIPAIALLASIAFWGDFYQLKILKNPKEIEKQENELKLISYNVHNMLSPRDNAKTLDSIVLFMRMSRADIICLQEFGTLSSADKATIDKNLSHFSYTKLTSDMAIFSRYEISDYKQIILEGSVSPATRATIEFQNKKFGLYNVHMRTTALNAMLPEGVRAAVEADDFAQRVINTATVVNENSVQRANQALQLDSIIKADSLPTIIMGDFNDAPASYVYSLFSEQRNDGNSDF